MTFGATKQFANNIHPESRPASEKLEHHVGARLREEIMKAAQDSVGNDTGWLGELERLAALHKEGQLSDDEYQIAKSKLLGS